MDTGLRGGDLSFGETKTGVSEVVPGKVFSGQARVNTRELKALGAIGNEPVVA